MVKKGKVMAMMWMVVLVLTLLTFPGSSSAANPMSKNKQTQSSFALDRIGSSAVFPIRGNVYPDGYYYVALSVGIPPKTYFLDIDTGGDLTWLQCDAPCVRCNKAPHPPYRPNKNNIISCSEPICVALHVNDEEDSYPCNDPREQCDYEVEYADQALSLGVLVRDAFPLRLTNGSILAPRLAFGCGYDQQVPNPTTSKTDGVLGLGNGSSGIVAQLRKLGITKNVIGHCISGRGGGYLFFGDDLVPSSGVTWTPMSSSASNKHYSPGPAELLYGTKSTGVKKLLVIFDSGSSYTYFNLQAYQAFISSVRKDLAKAPLKAVDDKTLPVCWKGAKPFKSIQDVKKYFTPVTLSFGSGRKKTQLVIPPEGYLIITSNGNVCLGILSGSEVDLADLNIIGDISLQDVLVIYDNEKHQIGWIPQDCNRLPKSGTVPQLMDREDEEDLFQAYAGNKGILTEQLSTTDGEL